MFKRKNKVKTSTSRQLITKKNPRSSISEQFRTLRTNIEYSVTDGEIRSIVITSTGPSEGKSTIIANLAVVFAQQGKKVLLIDADMRKPTTHYTFRLPNKLGLTNVLTKKQTLDETVQATDVENLYVLTSGPIPPNPAEMLGSQALNDLIKEVKEKYDLLLFDSPPVLAVTDAQIIANKCDGTILVINSGNTVSEAALKAKELLLNSKAKILGVVLNRKKAKESQYYYYYGNQ